MDPLSIGITAGVSLADAIFSGDSPQEQALKQLAGELDKSWVSQGLSEAERLQLLQNFRSMILKQSATDKARTTGSLARRGADANTINNAMVKLGNREAEAVNKLPGDILQYHLDTARRRRDALQNQYTSLAASMPGKQGLGDVLSEFGKQFSYYNWNRKNKPLNPLDEYPQRPSTASPRMRF